MRYLAEKLTAFVMGLSLIVLAIFHQTYDYNNKKPGTEVAIVIPDGATGSEIASILEKQKVIKSKKYFVEYYLKNRHAIGIAPGIHSIQTHISTKLAVVQLLDQKRIRNSVEVREGSTFSDVMNSLKRNPNIKLEKLNQVNSWAFNVG